MRRPESARNDAELGLEAFPQRGQQFVGRVADDGDPGRLEPEREQLAGEKRAVQVGAVAADELASRDDDRSPRPPRGRLYPQEGTEVICCGVTETVRGQPDASASGLPPFSDSVTYAGRLTLSQRPCSTNFCEVRGASVPW